MTDQTVNLDEYRGMAAQKATETRRQRLYDAQADQRALQLCQEEFEKLLFASPAETWPEAAAKAQYLVRLFGDTLEAQEPRRQEFIAQVLDDLNRLSDRGRQDSR